MVDEIDDRDWERLDKERERAKLTTQSEIIDWLTPWEKGTHQVKWGKDKSGKQRYKTVEGRSAGPGTRQLAEELARPLEITDEISRADKVRELPKSSEIDRVYIPSKKSQLKEQKQSKGEDITSDRIDVADTVLKVKRSLTDARREDIDVRPIEQEADTKIEGIEIEEESEGITRLKDAYGDDWAKQPKKVLIAAGVRAESIDGIRSGDIT